jgi:hypothetical protein
MTTTTAPFHGTSQATPASPALAAPKVAIDPAKWNDDAGYMKSLSGRLACATLAFALLAAAGLAAFGDESAPIAITAVTLVCIIGGFWTIGLAIERHGTMALALVLSLPPVAGVYYAAMHLVVARGALTAAIFAVLAILPIWASARSST